MKLNPKALLLCGAAVILFAANGGFVGASEISYHRLNATRLNVQECREVTRAADSELPVPYIEKLRLGKDLPSYITENNNTLDYVVAEGFPYRRELNQAVEEWNEKLDGKIRLREVGQPSQYTIRVAKVKTARSSLGEADLKEQRLDVHFDNYLYPDSIRSTILHEFGHLLGLAHSCSGTLMATTGQKFYPHVTPTDLAGVMQGRF